MSGMKSTEAHRGHKYGCRFPVVASKLSLPSCRSIPGGLDFWYYKMVEWWGAGGAGRANH